jgi:CDP-paratose 2-epimerase
MPTAIVTGSGGLVGSESVIHFAERGWTVVGLDNDMRARFFGPDASTAPMTARLARRFPIEDILREIHDANVEQWTAA